MAAEAGFDVQINSMEFASSLAAAPRGEFQAYLIGWSGRVDTDGNIYAFLHTGAGEQRRPLQPMPTVDKLLDQARGMTDVAQRAALYAQMWPQLRQDLPITYLCTPRQHRRHVGQADRFPSGARRNDPAAGPGDGASRAWRRCADISARGSRRSFRRCCWSACWCSACSSSCPAIPRWCWPARSAAIRRCWRRSAPSCGSIGRCRCSTCTGWATCCTAISAIPGASASR